MNLCSAKHQVDTEKNIISIVINDAFNEYDINAVIAKIQPDVELLDSQGFYMVIDVSDCEGGTPGGFEASRKFNLWLDNKNLLAKAIVGSSAMFKHINESRVRDTKKQLVAYLDNKQQALQWFAELKFA